MRHPVDYAPSQDFGDNPTSILPASHWIIKQFGNYQPDGHTGTDYPCPVGTPVRAVADGTVLHAGFYGGTYSDNPFWISPGFAGYCYVVDHGAFIGIYGHCRDGGALVHVGQRVTEGQILGPSGNTGASTGPHLHFEALPDGFVLNSYMYGRINPARLFGGITPQGSTTTPIQEDDMAVTDDDLRKIYDAVWFGAPGAKLIPNEAAGNSEWPYTTLGSLTARIGRDVIRPQLAELKGSAGQSAISPAEVADAVIAELGSDLAQIVVDEIGKRLAK